MSVHFGPFWAFILDLAQQNYRENFERFWFEKYYLESKKENLDTDMATYSLDFHFILVFFTIVWLQKDYLLMKT